MLSYSIVPKCDRIFLPFKSASELRESEVLVYKFKERGTFFLFHVFYLQRKKRIDEYPFFTALRMRADNRMFDRRIIFNHV